MFWNKKSKAVYLTVKKLPADVDFAKMNACSFEWVERAFDSRVVIGYIT